MQNLLRSWRAALGVLLPHNLVSLSLVTLKTVIEVYGLILRYFWWFLLGGVAALFWFPHIIMLVAWLVVWLTILVEASRPSLLPKTYRYFEENALSCFPLLLLFFTACCVSSTAIYLVAPYFMFMMFFLCDAHYRLYDMAMAPIRALKLSLALAPLYVLVAFLLYLSGMLFCCSVIVPTFFMLFAVLPLFVVVISRLYVLWIHKEYKDYYERCW